MTTRVVTTCDRCNLEIKQPYKVFKLTIEDPTENDYVKELCEDCDREVKGLIHDGPQSGIPRGFKKVPRPCPHHVPCADPDGCSGYEIVPR